MSTPGSSSAISLHSTSKIWRSRARVRRATSKRGSTSSSSSDRFSIEPPTRSIPAAARAISRIHCTRTSSGSADARGRAPIPLPLLSRAQQLDDVAAGRARRSGTWTGCGRIAGWKLCRMRIRHLRCRRPRGCSNPIGIAIWDSSGRRLSTRRGESDARDRLRLACYYAQDLTLAQTGRGARRARGHFVASVEAHARCDQDCR